MTKFFAVMVNGKAHTQQEVTVEMFTSKGYQVQKSRRIGDYDVFTTDGIHKIATLFSNKTEAATYLAQVKASK